MEAPSSPVPTYTDADADLRAALEKLPAPVRELLGNNLVAGAGPKAVSYFAERPFRDRTARPTNTHKFSPTERLDAKCQAAQMERMGYTHGQIAEHMQLSHSTVSKYIAETREEYKRSIIEVRGEMAMRELAVLMDVRQKAYEGMLLAQEAGVSRRTHKEKLTHRGLEVEDVEVDEGTLPPTEYLNIIIRTNERICDMFGLDEAVKQVINVNTTNNTVLTGEALLTTVLAAAQQNKQSPVRVKLAEIEAGPRLYDTAHANGDGK